MVKTLVNFGIHTGVAICMTRDTLEFHPRRTTLFFKSIIVLYHTKANCRCSWIYPLWSIFFQGSGMIKRSEDRGPFSSFSVFPLTQATCAAILWALQSTKLSLSLCISFKHKPSFKLHVLPSLPSVRVSVSPPSGPLARRFFSFSSVRVMNHTCTQTFAFTHSHKLPST